MATAGRTWLVVYLKGLCMGAADAVPGVSGGTIALIVGVYERLLTAITNVDPDAVTELLGDLSRVHTRPGRASLAATLLRLDAPFVAVLLAGVFTALATVAGVMHVAVTDFPVPTYAFFFGLIAASAVVLRHGVSLDTLGRVLAGLVGFTFAFLVSGAARGALPHTLPVLFLSGAIAITAMVLPGISGSFILLLLGQYEFMTEIPSRLFDSLSTGDLEPLFVLAAFGLGALAGLFSIAHVVKWALTHYRRGTLVFLVALMVGALRVPADEVAANVTAWTPGTVAVVVGAGVAGAALVLGLDYVTDELDY
ncbi:DUF368 domain-containing protein [Natronomonas sp. EA1]|uniref:DUF368 domain-containing protein n=1 Tax=Natronomonas sp. EA1 TaxID=3421655 RepID=UPI003EBA8A6A